MNKAKISVLFLCFLFIFTLANTVLSTDPYLIDYGSESWLQYYWITPWFEEDFELGTQNWQDSNTYDYPILPETGSLIVNDPIINYGEYSFLLFENQSIDLYNAFYIYPVVNSTFTYNGFFLNFSFKSESNADNFYIKFMSENNSNGVMFRTDGNGGLNTAECPSIFNGDSWSDTVMGNYTGGYAWVGNPSYGQTLRDNEWHDISILFTWIGTNATSLYWIPPYGWNHSLSGFPVQLPTMYINGEWQSIVSGGDSIQQLINLTNINIMAIDGNLCIDNISVSLWTLAPPEEPPEEPIPPNLINMLIFLLFILIPSTIFYERVGSFSVIPCVILMSIVCWIASIIPFEAVILIILVSASMIIKEGVNIND